MDIQAPVMSLDPASHSDPFKPRLPRLSGPYIRGFSSISDPARAYMDRVFDFLGMDTDAVRRRWFDSVRHGATPVISWMPGRSYVEPIQMLRHTWVRYAFDDFILRSGATLTIETPFSDPVEIYLYRLVVMPGARVVIRGGPAKFTIGRLVGARPEASEPALIEMVSDDGRPGEPGARGADGVYGSHEMPRGGPGHGGSQGSDGTPGRKLHDMTLQVHTLTGQLRLKLRPGRGGAGGRGGDGGRGAIGHSISLYGMGEGGDGADGMTGGNGGDGGDSGLLRLDVRVREPGASLDLDVNAGQPGRGGPGGEGGAGGTGIPDGRPGVQGAAGADGRPGRPAVVEWAQGGAL
jgi:hypothetical protein